FSNSCGFYVLFSRRSHLLYKLSANGFIFHCRVSHYGVWSDNEKQTNYLTDSYLKDMTYVISFFVGPELSSDLIILVESLDDKVIQRLFQTELSHSRLCSLVEHSHRLLKSFLPSHT